MIGEGRPFTLTVDGKYLFYTDLGSGIRILDIKFGDELSRLDLATPLRLIILRETIGDIFFHQ
ncbi:MAG: hypothetical protein R2883_06395 [Caldisericia bacterium]